MWAEKRHDRSNINLSELPLGAQSYKSGSGSEPIQAYFNESVTVSSLNLILSLLNCVHWLCIVSVHLICSSIIFMILFYYVCGVGVSVTEALPVQTWACVWATGCQCCWASSYCRGRVWTVGNPSEVEGLLAVQGQSRSQSPDSSSS